MNNLTFNAMMQQLLPLSQIQELSQAFGKPDRSVEQVHMELCGQESLSCTKSLNLR